MVSSEDPTESTPANESKEPIPFWNVNVPVHLQTKECPDFLRYAFTNEKDRRMLSTPDKDYRFVNWDGVVDIINRNRIDLFIRRPSDLRRYREYCDKLVSEYGSVMEFVMRERLQWRDLEAKGEPFCELGERACECAWVEADACVIQMI